MNKHRCPSKWNIITMAGILLYIIFSIVYLLWGRLNADEGWYLYASRLVFKGQIPYRDFAYTQAPLLPYIYGIPQAVVHSSILVGRMTSVLFSLVNFVVCVATTFALFQ